MEIWKPIAGYCGIYEVSQLGNVRSLDRICKYKDGRKAHFKGKVLKPIINSDGYLQIQLYNGTKVRTLKIHRLVAEAFIPNPENLPEVNHKDEDKTNNCLNNLEWCNHPYNSRYGTRGAKIAAKHGCPVIAYLPDDPTAVIRFESIASAAKHFQVSAETVRQAIKNGWKCKKHAIFADRK